jgi:hypothetical protein
MTTDKQKRGMAQERASAEKNRNMEGGGARTVHSGVFVAIHSAAPPPIVEYDAWLDLQLAKTRGKQTKWTGAKLRRAVIMRRNGCSPPEIGVAVGYSSREVSNWLAKLPEGLRA